MFKVGDYVVCVNAVYFCNGESHEVGQRIRLTNRTVHYYNHPLNVNNYVLVNPNRPVS